MRPTEFFPPDNLDQRRTISERHTVQSLDVCETRLGTEVPLQNGDQLW